MKLRKQVLGADYVERSMASADDFSMPMQELSTEYCWGHVGSRPGLARSVTPGVCAKSAGSAIANLPGHASKVGNEGDGR
jgi:hypothetical protein